jgi:CubicO group peptidase (beta-lactamase class C family)
MDPVHEPLPAQRMKHTTPRTIPFIGLILALATLAACASRPPAPGADADLQIRRVATGLVTQNVVRGDTPRLTMEERMAFYRVPGVSVAVIDDGQLVWAGAWGVVEAGSDTPMDTTTLFQAASISKPVAAAGALALVEEGLLALDDDVNGRLRSWRVPENRFTAAEKVTLRRLLSHSAGTTVHGFPGYATDASVPSIVQVLDGAAPANTAPVRVDTVPGSRWRYSGGGTSIVQLLMMDGTGKPFEELMRERVLEPAGMTRSTFAQPLPPERDRDAATAHRGDGSPVPGRYHTYPEQAAAGLWTTPSDLARFALEIQAAAAGAPDRILSPAMAREMLTPQARNSGLGFSLDGEGNDRWFLQGGSNAGFQSYFAALVERGQGVVVMTNGDGGVSLAMEVVRAVAREYDLPGFRPTVRDALELGPAELAPFAGDYFGTGEDAPPEPLLQLRLDGAVLRADIPRIGWADLTLRAAAPDSFFFLENAGEIEFERDATGRVMAAVVTGLGPPVRLERR